MKRIVWLVAACTLVLTASLTAFGAKRAGYARWGEVSLGFEESSGLNLRYRGEPLVAKSSATFHDGQWQHVYYSLPHQLSEVVVDSTPQNRSLRVAGHPRDGLLGVEHVITPQADGTLRIELTFESNRDVPMSVEYCALQLSTAPLVGCAYATTTDKGTTMGTVPHVCAGPNAMLARKAREFSVVSRLGTIRFRTEGDEAWLDVLDGRKRSWADPQDPILWIGALSQKVQPHVKQRLTFTLSFSGPGAEKPGVFQTISQAAAPLAAAELRAPAKPSAGPLIPVPKEVQSLPGAFVIHDATPIVVGQRADLLDRRAAEVLRRELKTAYGVELAIKTSAEVTQREGAIVLGEPALNPLAAAACRDAGISVTAKASGPEGYVLSASPAGVVVAGADRRGTYWGVQTLLQLLRASAGGHPSIAGVAIRDWPDFPLRAAHWSISGKEVGFQRRMIDAVLARHKINTLFLECESIGWESHPELNPQGIRPAEVADLVRYANERFIEVIPQIQSLGHCKYWLLHKHPELAENPEAPDNYCPSNPDTYKLLFDLYREAEAIFHPRYFHIGHDEVNSDFGICPRCKGQPPAELFAAEVRELRDYWAQRQVPVMMWSDMLLAPLKPPGSLDACNGGPPLNIAQAISMLPKDVIICDWHYGDKYREYPSLALFQANGFRTIATPWYRLDNIWHFSRAAQSGGAMGVMGSTWCSVEGPECEPACLVRSLKYLYALIYTADCMWSVGRRAPDALPYDPAERFLAAVRAESVTPPSKPLPGFLVDLAPYGTRSLVDKPDAPGWLGYGPQRDLSGLPTGRVRLAGTEFLVPAGPRKAVMLWGTYTGNTKLPREVRGIPVKKRAGSLVFLHVCGWAVTPASKVGEYRVTYADGSAETIPLIQGGNIADPTYPLRLTAGRTVWNGTMADGTPVHVYDYAWQNPHAEREIASIDFLSSGTHASPTLLGLSVVDP